MKTKSGHRVFGFLFNILLVLFLLFGFFDARSLQAVNADKDLLAITPAGDSLEIVQGGSLQFTLVDPHVLEFTLNATAALTDNGYIAWFLALPPAFGDVLIDEKGFSADIHYFPAPSLQGVDRFIIRAIDDRGNSDAVTVTVVKKTENPLLHPASPPPALRHYQNESFSPDGVTEGGGHLLVHPAMDDVEAWDFLPNTTITLTIGTFSDEKMSDGDGWVRFYTAPFDIQPGQLVEMDDGVSFETHTVRDFTIDEINSDTDTVSGKAEPGSYLAVYAWYGDTFLGWADPQPVADGDGNWVANFSGIADIRPGVSGGVNQWDDDGDETQVHWYIPSPNILVHPLTDDVEGWDFLPDTIIELTIGDYSASALSDENGWVRFEIAPFNIVAGQLVEMNDGVSYQSHKVKNIAITKIITDTDKVKGTAKPGSELAAGVWVSGEPVYATPNPVTGSTGIWTANFTGLADIQPGTSGWINQWDADGDTTQLHWRLPSAHLLVHPVTDDIEAWDFTPNKTITLKIGTYTTSMQADSTGWVHFYLNDFDIQPGQLVEMNDGVFFETHLVRDFSIAEFDLENDTVGGTAEPGSELAVGVWVNDAPVWASPNPVADGDGTWTADFSGLADIKPGIDGWANQWDDDSDETQVHWRIRNPMIRSYHRQNSEGINDLYSDRVYGYDWLPDTPVTLSLDGSVYDTLQSDVNGSVRFNMDVTEDIEAGMVLEMTDGETTRTLTIVLAISEINDDIEILSGKAAPGLVETYAQDLDTWMDLNITADALGDWQADYSSQLDFVPGSSGDVSQYDQQGNETYISWQIRLPRMIVDPDLDTVTGTTWIPGANINLNIDAGSYDGYLNASVAGEVVFGLSGVYDILAGQELTMSEEVESKFHQVRDYGITNFDLAADDIIGYADPGSFVQILADDGIPPRWFIGVMTDENGVWIADFTGMEDIKIGTIGNMYQWDEDADGTNRNYIVANKIPLLQSLSPAYAWMGTPALTLLVNGADFSAGYSKVIWDDEERETTFVNEGQLSVGLDAADLATARTVQVQVSTSEPGGGSSGVLNFAILSYAPAYDQKLTTSKLTFDWDDVPDATNYKLQLSTKKDFSVLTLSTGTIDSSYAYGTKLANNTTYYWRVRPKIGGVWQPWSPVMRFTSMDPLAKPILQSPANKAIITDDNSPLLEWNAVTNGVTYLVQLSKLSDFSTIYYKETVGGTSRETPLLPNGKYFWRVRALDASGGKGPWSEVRMFKIAVP